MEQKNHDRGLLQALLGDGRPLLLFCGLSLVLAGGFALFLSASKHFLPHDVQYLGMTAEQLCGIQNCRVVYFMFHDRVAFGGALIAIGALYMWLAEFPLRQRKAWAWWLLLLAAFLVSAVFLPIWVMATWTRGTALQPYCCCHASLSAWPDRARCWMGRAEFGRSRDRECGSTGGRPSELAGRSYWRQRQA